MSCQQTGVQIKSLIGRPPKDSTHMAAITARNKGIRLSDIRVEQELKDEIEGLLLKEIEKTRNPNMTTADIRRMLYKLGLKAYKEKQQQLSC